MNTVAWVSVCCGGAFQTGGSTLMFATAYDQNGTPIQFPSFTWSSSNASVASVSAFGSPASVSFNSPGTATIAVSSGGRYAYANVQVLAPPVVTSVTISPTGMSLTAGQSASFIARAYDQYGNQMTGGSRTWSSANTSIATVSSSGKVTGVAVGTTTVQVTIDGVSASATVNVGSHLSISLDGPYFASTEGQYTWSVQALGGTGSYTYKWTFEPTSPWGLPSVVGYGSSYSMWIDSSVANSFILYVEVTSGSETATAQMGVCNFTASAMC